MCRRLFFLLIVTLLAIHPATATEIVTDANGRTTSVITTQAGDITFRMTAAGDKELFLRYRPVDVLTQPVVLTKDDKEAKATADPATGDALLDIPSPATPFVLYDIIEHRPAGSTEPVDGEERKRHEKYLKEAQKKVKDLSAALAETNADIEAFTKSPAPAAVDEIKRLEAERRDITAHIREQQAIIEEEQKAIADLDALSAKNEEAAEAYVLRKIGVVIQGVHRYPIVYAFSEPTETVLARVERVSNVPSLTDFDRGYVVISNVVPARHPEPFDITVTWKAGVALTLTPVRPVQPVPGTGTASFIVQSFPPTPTPKPRELPLIGEATAYRDVAAEIESLRFHGGEVPQVTVKTRGHVVTEDKVTTEDGTSKATKTVEVQESTLLNNAELPQVRTHYRYNFTTGIIVTDLRNPEFQKVLTTPDDTMTEKVNEARYRTDVHRGGRRLNGILGLTYYIRPVDPLRRLSFREALIPNPTIGFGLSEPLENVFAGFSNEVIRNVQILWGVHYGKIDELVNRNDVTEDQEPSAPPTRKRFHAKPFVGLTLNLNFLDKVLGR